MQNKHSALIVLVGPSGVGNTTIAQTLIAQGIANRMVRSITDRPKADKEDNTEYVFVDKGTIIETDCVEHVTFDGFTYGVLRTELRESILSGRAIVRTDINGARQLRRYCYGMCDVVTVFIDARTDEIRARLESRGRGRVEERLAMAEKIRADISECDFYMVNGDGLLPSIIHNINSIYELVGA